MKPWRERIAEARERGSFTVQDKRDIEEINSCMVGEAAQSYLGLQGQDAPDSLKSFAYNFCFGAPWRNGNGPMHAVLKDKFSLAEKCLDAVEDHALKLKREAM